MASEGYTLDHEHELFYTPAGNIGGFCRTCEKVIETDEHIHCYCGIAFDSKQEAQKHVGITPSSHW